MFVSEEFSVNCYKLFFSVNLLWSVVVDSIVENVSLQMKRRLNFKLFKKLFSFFSGTLFDLLFWVFTLICSIFIKLLEQENVTIVRRMKIPLSYKSNFKDLSKRVQSYFPDHFLLFCYCDSVALRSLRDKLNGTWIINILSTVFFRWREWKVKWRGTKPRRRRR